jgi:hypothetical protein
MAGIPSGMAPATFDYLLRFTMAHEGATPFMYNNWPLKNANRDVTVGVGIAVFSEDHAVRPDIRSLFRVKATGEPASDPEMRAEFRRVYDLPRTAGNLFTDYQDKSPLEIPDAEMRRSLSDKMSEFWDQRGQTFADFASIPAQAQVALASWNYGARLRNAPNMCNAVRSGDFVEAAKQSFVPGWDGQKNEGHRRLLMNAATIAREGLDNTLLPPMGGPFKPPPMISASGSALLESPVGEWNVRVEAWLWVYSFESKSGTRTVRWTDPYNNMTGTGSWNVAGDKLHIAWQSGSRDTWNAPFNPARSTGSCFMTGSGKTFSLVAVKRD